MQDNPFEKFNLTEEETQQGLSLTDVQRRQLQNLRHQVCVDKLELKVNPLDIQSFVQEEAYLAGKLDVLTLILN
jgi:hypothetical protein